MAASASLLSPPSSSSINNYRMSQVCLGIHSARLQKCIMYTSVCLRNQKDNIKLYMIPCKSFPCCSDVRCFATTGSLEVDGKFQGNQTSSNIWAPNDSKSSIGKLDKSKKPFKNELEIKLQELFDEVKTMIRMGNNNDALDLLKANYEAVKEQMDVGGRGMEEAAVLDVLALGYIAIGDFKMVGFLLDLLNEVVNGLPDDEPLLDSVLTHMGSMYSTLGKFENSCFLTREFLESERENMSILVGNSSTLPITPLIGMGKVLGFIGRASKATDVHHRAITILESSCGTESEQLVVPLFALGNLLIKEGKVTDAEKTVRILNIYTRLYGENDGRVGMAMCSLANVKCAKAIHFYRNALQLLKDSESATLDDDIMEKIRIDLAELLHLVGRGKEGRALLEEYLLITEKHKGKDHPSSVTHLVNLATSYSLSKNFVEAEKLLRTSLQIMTKTVSPDDQSITFPMLNLAVTLYNLNRNEEAEQLALEVLRVREKAFGKESLPVGEALNCLASIQSRLEKDDSDLLELLRRVLRIQEKGFGDNSEEIMETLKKIVFYLDKMGMKNEKFRLQKRLSMLRAKYKQMVPCK